MARTTEIEKTMNNLSVIVAMRLVALLDADGEACPNRVFQTLFPLASRMRMSRPLPSNPSARLT